VRFLGSQVGMTQARLAEKAGLRIDSLSRIEKGKGLHPSIG
jgi:transcriptional regulator with XRE-family HTH domain